jgi:hypothetical protein
MKDNSQFAIRESRIFQIGIWNNLLQPIVILNIK